MGSWLKPLTWPGLWVSVAVSSAAVILVKIEFEIDLNPENLGVFVIGWFLVFCIAIIFSSMTDTLRLKEKDKGIFPWNLENKSKSQKRIKKSDRKNAITEAEEFLRELRIKQEKERANKREN